MFDLFATIGSFFTHLIPHGSVPVGTVPKTPDSVQGAINRLGQIMDTCEGFVDEFKTLIPLLPPVAAGPASIFVNGIHTFDSYLDAIETPPANPVTPGPAPVVATPASIPAAAGQLPTANL